MRIEGGGRTHSVASIALAMLAFNSFVGCDDDEVCGGCSGGTPCNDIASDWPVVCCGADEHCCTVGFEREACLPKDEECPTRCPQGWDWYCPAGLVCRARYHDWSTFPPDGTCEDEEGEVDLSCVESCAAWAKCGDQMCCGPYTRCEDNCCVADPPDGGVTDAGTHDGRFAGDGP